jgi:diaminopimelate decarboxylase
MMVLDQNHMADLIERFGSPLFYIDERALKRQVSLLENNLPDINLFYSMKANPSPFVIKSLAGMGLGVEVASQAELIVVLKLGVLPERVFFTAPSKTREDLRLALEHDIYAINVDNEQELDEIRNIARENDRPAKITFRVHQRLEANTARLRMSGQPTQFGMSPENILKVLRALKGDPLISVLGLHTYFGSNVFEVDCYEESFRHSFSLAIEAESLYGTPFKFIGLGGGFGYDATGRKRLDLGALRALIVANFQDHASFLKDKTVMMESGRYLTCTSTLYLTTVTYTKECLGVPFVIVNGGSHHRGAESAFSEMFSSGQKAFFLPERSGPSLEMRVVGCQCDPSDILSYKLTASLPQPGDLVVYPDSGSYALTARNALFLSHDRPAEVARNLQGQTSLVRRRRSALEEFDLSLFE